MASSFAGSWPKISIVFHSLLARSLEATVNSRIKKYLCLIAMPVKFNLLLLLWYARHGHFFCWCSDKP